MQTGAGGQREEGERGAEGETRAEDIAFWSLSGIRATWGSLLPRPPVNPRATTGGAGGTDALPALVPAILPALQGASLAALSRTGTSATRCWTLVGWPLV